MIRGVMFDFGNVLGIFDTLRWYEFINRYRGNCIDPKELYSGAHVDIVKDHDIGKLNDVEFYSKVRLLYRMSIPTFNDFYKIFGEIISFDLEMFKLVTDLKDKGVTTILITNMNSYHARYVRENFPELMNRFDYHMISCEEGVAKPMPEAWIRPLERSGLKAEECIFVDDVATNIQEACRLGIKGWHYNVTDQHFCLNGRLEIERAKLKDFLTLLDNRGMLYSKNKTR